MNCPDCSERLNAQARRCACGWKNPKYDVPESRPGQKHFDARCGYQFAGMRCAHPVGFFDAGSGNGWCIFHRHIDPATQHSLGADIVRDSQGCTPEQYLDMARRATYGRGDTDTVARIRAGLRGEMGGNLKKFQQAA